MKAFAISRSFASRFGRSLRRTTSRTPRVCALRSLTSTGNYESPYTHVKAAQITHELHFRDTSDPSVVAPFPIYSVMDTNGIPVDPEFDLSAFLSRLGHSTDDLLKMYRTMVETEIFDDVFYKVHRVGKTSFYMENTGEEVCQIGTAAALQPQDLLFFQYRELGSFLWRGLSFQEAADLNFTNARGHGKGRQMPVHYGKKSANCVTISSPLGTQLPQASGAAYALKRTRNDALVACYFGDGAASEGDAHAAFNLSATRECPVLWLCRNNGFAISTPTSDQYRGDGICARAYAYGMIGVRVDGGDLLATLEATHAARDLVLREQRPLLMELMCWRGSHHSTSDDSSRYRSKDEEMYWHSEGSPLARTKRLLLSQGLWDEERDVEMREEIRERVTDAADKAEACKRPSFDNLFSDVYDELTPELERQKKELYAHLNKYGAEKYYQLDAFEMPADYR